MPDKSGTHEFLAHGGIDYCWAHTRELASRECGLPRSAPCHTVGAAPDCPLCYSKMQHADFAGRPVWECRCGHAYSADYSAAPIPARTGEEKAPLTFAALQAANVARCVNGFKHTLESWSVAEWTNAICGEAGEAANIAKKMIRHRDGVAGNKGVDKDLAALRVKLGRELADTVIYCCLTAARERLDLGECVRETFNLKSDELGAKERL